MGEERQEEKIRVVFDTNVWVSIILKKTLGSELLPLVRESNQIEVVLSRDLVSELARVLTYSRIVKVLTKIETDPEIALLSILELVKIVEANQRVNVITSDPADNAVLECALAINAKYVVTGNPHLLKLGEFQGIKIMKARTFIDAIREN